MKNKKIDPRYGFIDEKHCPFLALIPKKHAYLPKGKNVESSFGKLMGVFLDKEVEVSVVFCSFNRYADLVNELGPRAQFMQVCPEGSDVKYEGVQLTTGYGRVIILPDRNVTKGVFYFEEK